MDCSIREAVESDISTIHTIHISCIQEICCSHYTQSDIIKWTGRQSTNRYLSHMRNSKVIVAELPTQGNKKEVVGFGHIGVTDREGCDHEVKALYVSPKVIGKGVGSALMKALQEIAKMEGGNKVLLFSSKNAVGFYEKLGFVKEECVKQCPDECDSLMCIKMTKTFKEQPT